MMKNTYREIKTGAQLNAYRKSLLERGIKKIAMDFEAEFNLHVYGEHLCLIQVFDGEEFLLIDPMNIDEKDLKSFLEMKSPVKVFFGADSDRSLVYKQYGIKIVSLYDVQHLVEVLDLDKKGLDGVLASQLNVFVEKKKKFQQYNWMKRPIDEEAKKYALGDVEHLFKLNDVLINKIQEAGLVEEMVFRIASGHYDYDKKSIPGIFKTSAYKKMNRRLKDRYGKIVEVRDKHAKIVNVPPNTVLTKGDLVEVTYDLNRIRLVRFNKRIQNDRRELIIGDILALES
jgi:ribonuclease D